MKLVIKYLFFFSLSLLLFFPPSCKKDLLKLISVTPGTFNDPRDGQVYKTTTIGSYTWLAQNLNFKTDSNSCYYNNDSTNYNVYGRLYIWRAAQAAVPSGWHLPTTAELKFLYYNLGSYEAGCQMKETGNAHWTGDNSCADNYSELTIIPGGSGESNSSAVQFNGLGTEAYFWEAQQCFWNVYDKSFVYGGAYMVYPPANMYAIRCVKNY